MMQICLPVVSLLLAVLVGSAHADPHAAARTLLALKSEKAAGHLAGTSPTMALCITLEGLAARRADGLNDSSAPAAACRKCQSDCRSFAAAHGGTDLCQC